MLILPFFREVFAERKKKQHTEEPGLSGAPRLFLQLEAHKVNGRNECFSKAHISTPTHGNPPSSDGPLIDREDLYTSPLPTQPRLVSSIHQLPNSDNEEEANIPNSSSTLTSMPILSTQLPAVHLKAPPDVIHPRSLQQNRLHASQIPSSPLTNILAEDEPPAKRS
ncbi:hypothetical protein K443DRAFT_9761 [Laccaria amethystina LaAM-08-1]|uniref:Uncharacterized protein n=1 Tax=Laccaria amethystina LaAM-08-1 TaxID=1095629 RepID=A0A0C9WLX5_9AGAR|nr:hypothetical protein K443DRAFT_9761 [Laccaria amethystina LaAM-08-1]